MRKAVLEPLPLSRDVKSKSCDILGEECCRERKGQEFWGGKGLPQGSSENVGNGRR